MKINTAKIIKEVSEVLIGFNKKLEKFDIESSSDGLMVLNIEFFMNSLGTEILDRIDWVDELDVDSKAAVYKKIMALARNEIETACKIDSQPLAGIKDIVESYGIELSRGQSTGNLWAISPFVDEERRSLAVNPEKGIYKCFESEKGGTGINFIMEMDGISYDDAIKKAEKIYTLKNGQT